MIDDPHNLVLFFLIAMGICLTIWNSRLQIKNHNLNEECNQLAKSKHNADMELSKYKRDVSDVVTDFCQSMKQLHGATA
jgi:hypothetical protein